MITVMGASGHTGRGITLDLLNTGQRVRALGRSEGKLAELKSAGAETLAGDGTDATFLTAAFRGAEAVYTLLPPDPQSADYRSVQDQLGEAIVKAVRESGVRYVVFLSSVGAEQATGTGPIAGLHAQENRLRKLAATNVMVLRPGFFFENFHASLGLVKQQGIAGDAVAPDAVLPMTGTRDIAAAAAQALRARDWTGVVVRELLGPRDLTHAEAVRIIGARIGQPELRYVQFPYADTAQALVRAGLSESFAGLYVEMARAFNEGRVKSLEGRNAQNTTPTRFEDFADELALAYQGL